MEKQLVVEICGISARLNESAAHKVVGASYIPEILVETGFLPKIVFEEEEHVDDSTGMPEGRLDGSGGDIYYGVVRFAKRHCMMQMQNPKNICILSGSKMMHEGACGDSARNNGEKKELAFISLCKT
uniref:Ketoacyl_synth_N domain-containing protein n=1 Tax=Ascaris lumbricoides TaxID=6252 RepID=A0A0M3IDT8_ASCLU